MLFRRLAPLPAVLVGLSLLAQSPSAEAAFSLKLTSGAQTVTITDGDNVGPDVDGAPAANQIQYDNTNFNFFDVSITVTTNSPGATILDQNGNPVLAGRVRDVTLTTRYFGMGSGTLTFDVSSDGFNLGPAGSGIGLESRFGGDILTGNGSNATFTSSVNGTTTPVLTLVAPNPTTIVTSAAATIPSNPFTISNQMVLNLVQGGQANLTGTSTVAVPAPAGIVLALTGLPVLGLSRWIRRRKQPT
jgi:hypothetical protein